MDRVLEDTKEETKYRFDRGNVRQPQGQVLDGERKYKKVKVRKTNKQVDLFGSSCDEFVEVRNHPKFRCRGRR